jgi:hypothetical protein
MKLSKIAMVSCFFLILSIAKAEPTWVQLPGGTQDKEPKLTVLESSNTGTIINLKTSGAWVEDVSEKNVVFKRITLEGQGQTDETGKPGLPVFNKLVAIPATAEVTVEVISKNEAVLKNYLVYPAQQEVISAKPSFEIDDGFYIQDALYPNEIVEVSAPAIMNDVRLVRLCVYPFRYNPAKRELRVITDITIRLSYSGYDGRNTL